METTPINNRDRYAAISKERGVSARCPFATVETCPRFYQSLSLMGAAGSTKIPDKEDKRLLKKWEKSDLWPRTAEQQTSLMGGEGPPSMYMNFCPEITLDQFGLASTFLATYTDEWDADAAHRRLLRDGASVGHPHWRWSSITEQHFAECPLYSILSYRKSHSKEAQEPWWRKYLFQIIVAVVVAIVGIAAKMVAG